LSFPARKVRPEPLEPEPHELRLVEKEARVLVFGKFHPDTRGVIVWAEGPGRRVQFLLSFQILADALGAINPSWGMESAEFCEQHRVVIEAGCKRAYRSRPSMRIELRTGDFNDGLMPTAAKPVETTQEQRPAGRV
jgi:hypothetical protein